MTNPPQIDTEQLIESLGRFRIWVLPSGVMRELLSRGTEIEPALMQRLTKAIELDAGGLGPPAPEAFFCFHLLSVASPLSCREFIDRLLRRDAKAITLCTGDVTQPFLRALVTSLADKVTPETHCEWVDSLVQDDKVNLFCKTMLVSSLFNLVGEESLQDAEAVRWIQKWLHERRTYDQDEFSACVVENLIDVGGDDLKQLATECFDRGQIDQRIVEIGDLDEMSDDRQKDYLSKTAEEDRRALLDPVDYLSSWHAFAWTTNDLDPQSAAYERIRNSDDVRKRKPDADEMKNWLAEIDGSSYEVYPRDAIQRSRLYVDSALDQLKERVRLGIEWAKEGKKFSSNAPYLSALMLAKHCDSRSALMTDAQIFLDILDLSSEQRFEWFGDTIDTYLIEAITCVLAGQTRPILQRIDDRSRDELDLASLVSFFPISVYLGYLGRDQCLELLRDLWQSDLRKDQEGNTDGGTVLPAIFDAFCMLSVEDSDPVWQQAEAAGIGNGLMTAHDAEKCRTDPSRARDVMKAELLLSRSLKDIIEKGLQFDDSAIHEPAKKVSRRGSFVNSSLPLDLTLLSPGRDDTIPKKVGRNAACPCGSGKKYKRCCGKR